MVSENGNEQGEGGAAQEVDKPVESLRELLLTLLTGLFDLQFQSLITTRMLPTIYGLGMALAALFSLWLIALGFNHSWQRGLIWLLVLGPACFIALTVFWRVVLEFVLTIFRIAVYVQVVTERTQEIGGMVEGIDSDLPRIQFWKSGKRKKDE